MTILDKIRNLFRPKSENAAAEELKRAGDEPDMVPSSSAVLPPPD